MGEPITHSSTEDLHGYAVGDLSGDAKLRVAEHLANCAICQAELEMVKSFCSVPADTNLGATSTVLQDAFDNRIGIPPKSTVSRPRVAIRWRRPVGYSLIAASLALLIVGGFALNPRDLAPVPGSEFRHGGTDAVVVEISDQVNHWLVRWVMPDGWSTDGGDRVVVFILDSAGQVICEQRTESGMVKIVRSELPPTATKPLFVRVTVRGANGSTVQSGLQLFVQ